jgi:phage tail-like protein
MKMKSIKSSLLAAVAFWAMAGSMPAADPVFASGVVDSEFTFAYNQPGAELMGKLGSHPNIVIFIGEVAIDGVLEVSGSMDLAVRPENHKPGKMTITRNYANTSEFYSWRKAVLDGKVDRRTISVHFVNDDGTERSSMNFFECWPQGYKGPSLNSRSSGHAGETIELVFERIELK